MRLAHTKRKDYNTIEVQDHNNITYLVWEVFPVEVDLSAIEVKEGLRIWIAGTSLTDKWTVKKYHPAGSFGFAEGGYTAMSDQGEVTYISLTEAILHPTLIQKRKKK